MRNQLHYKCLEFHREARDILTPWRESDYKAALIDQESFLNMVNPWPPQIKKESLIRLLDYDIIPFAFDRTRDIKDRDVTVKVKAFLCLAICGKSRAKELTARIQQNSKVRISTVNLDGERLAQLKYEDTRIVMSSVTPGAWTVEYCVGAPETTVPDFVELKSDDPWFIDIVGSDWETDIDLVEIVLKEAPYIQKAEFFNCLRCQNFQRQIFRAGLNEYNSTQRQGFDRLRARQNYLSCCTKHEIQTDFERCAALHVLGDTMGMPCDGYPGPERTKVYGAAQVTARIMKIETPDNTWLEMGKVFQAANRFLAEKEYDEIPARFGDECDVDVSESYPFMVYAVMCFNDGGWKDSQLPPGIELRGINGSECVKIGEEASEMRHRQL